MLLTVLLLLLFGRLWMGNGSYRDIWHMNDQIKTIGEANQTKIDENRKLEAEIEEFQSGDAAILERARTEFGMVKKGETFYQVILKPEEIKLEKESSLDNEGN